MHVSKSNPASFKLIISVYLLLILFISLLVVITSDGGTTVLTTGDIDKMLQKKWSEKNLKPSGKSSDEDFIRRVYLDVTGRTPTADEVKSFLDDESGDKRKKKIDELLASPEYGEFAADIWMQILFQYGGKRRVPPQTYTLVKDEFAANFNNNKPYTEFVSKLVSSEGFVSTNPYALFAGRFETPEDAAGSTMKIFMGKQIQCAQCHKHPYEKISQEDFYGVASFFTRKQVLPLLQKDQADKITKAIVRMEKLIEQARDMEMENSGNQEMNEEMMNSEEHKNVKKNKKKQDKSQNKQKKKKYNIPPQWAIDSLKNRSMNPTFKPDVLVWDAINGQLTYEVKGEKKTAYPKFLGGASVSNEPGVDRRKLLAENMTTNETKQLSQAFVNRFWKHFFG
jgi:hypothetical protein